MEAERIAEAEALWAAGLPAAEVADHLGISTRQLQHARGEGKLNMPTRPKGGCGRRNESRDPTPRELLHRAARVREQWSEEERLGRIVGGRILSATDLRRLPVPKGREAYQRDRVFVRP